MKTIKLSVFETWFLGLLVSLLMTILLKLVFPWYGALGIAIGFLLLGASKRIPIGYEGVATFFKSRFCLNLKEGIHFWPFLLGFGFEEVNCKEQELSIPTIEVLASDGTVKIDSGLRYRIVNPRLYLSIDMGDGFKTLAEQVLRSRTANLTAEEARQLHLDLQNGLQQECDKKATKDWGIDVVNVWLKDIGYTEEEKKARQQQVVEKWQRNAEAVEQDFVREQIRKYQQMGISADKAAELVQTERGKVKKEVREFKIPGLEKGINVNLGGKE